MPNMYKKKFIKYKNKHLQNGGGLCIICQERPANIVLKPCEHNILCKLCTALLMIENNNARCPICNQKEPQFYTISDKNSLINLKNDKYTDTPSIRKIEFKYSIEFPIYYILKKYFTNEIDDPELLKNDKLNQLILNFLSIFKENFSEIYDNIVQTDKNTFENYVKFIFKKEIINKKIYDDDKIPNELKIKNTNDIENEISELSPRFMELVFSGNGIIQNFINKKLENTKELNEKKKKELLEKRDLLTAIYDQIDSNLNMLRDPLKTKFKNLYLINKEGILDEQLDDSINIITNNLSIVDIIIYYFNRIRLSRPQLNQLFNDLKTKLNLNHIDINSTTPDENVFLIIRYIFRILELSA